MASAFAPRAGWSQSDFARACNDWLDQLGPDVSDVKGDGTIARVWHQNGNETPSVEASPSPTFNP